jgi:hypothetical protein
MKNNTTRKTAIRKTLTLDLTAEQYDRIAGIAKMLNVPAQHLAISQIMVGFDGWGSWEEFTDAVHDSIETYAEGHGAAWSGAHERMETTAPGRLQKLGGFAASHLGART